MFARGPYPYVCKYVCMFKMKGCVMVCHTVSGLKCGIRKTPPTSFRSPKKHVGGVYFRWSGEIFLRNFMPYPPRKIPGLKGGDLLFFIYFIFYISLILLYIIRIYLFIIFWWYFFILSICPLSLFFLFRTIHIRFFLTSF